MPRRHLVVGVAGILTFLITISALFIPSHVTYETMTAEQIAHTMQSDGPLQATQAYVHALGATGFLVWVVLMFPIIRRLEKGTGGMAHVVLATGAAAATVLAIPATFTLAAYANRSIIDPMTFRALHLVSWSMMFLSIFIVSVFLGAMAVAMWRTGLVARWVGTVTMSLAAVQVLVSPIAVLTMDGGGGWIFAPYVLFMFWVLLVSVALVVGRRDRVDAASPAARGVTPLP